MVNFDAIKMENSKFQIIIVMKTSEPPLDFLPEIAHFLKFNDFSGAIVIDQLLHSGNSNERFIGCYFDGKGFQKSSFQFETLDRRNAIRKYACDLLREDPDYIDLTLLNQFQKNLITKGCYI